MKKTIFAFAVVLGATFVSCSTGKCDAGSATDSDSVVVNVDSMATDSMVVDSLAVDSAVIVGDSADVQ